MSEDKKISDIELDRLTKFFKLLLDIDSRRRIQEAGQDGADIEEK
jgi:hypothetical protein